MTAKELIQFESDIAELFKAKKLKCPIHLSGGNEQQLIDIFKGIASWDYVFSTHRNHYHYLLHTRDKEGLEAKILAGDSMHTCSLKHNFYSSSIVAGCVAIACGVALALKMKGSHQKVWCFVGDGATDEGWFLETVRYSYANRLPINYVIEDNNRSVCSTTEERWNGNTYIKQLCQAFYPITIYYNYTCKQSHAGCGEWVTF